MNPITFLLYLIYLASTAYFVNRIIKEAMVDGEYNPFQLIGALVPGLNALLWLANNRIHNTHYAGPLQNVTRYRDRIVDEVDMMARRRELTLEWAERLVDALTPKEGKTFTFGPNILVADRGAAQKTPAVSPPKKEVFIPEFLRRRPNQVGDAA